jgi:hypothetical protein
VVSTVDGLLSGASPAAPTAIDLDISFDGYTIYDGGGTAVADTGTPGNGDFDFAIASGADSSATAEGGLFDAAYADGTNALANAGSLTTGATDFNFDYAEDIGNNTTVSGFPDGAYAGGGSLVTGGVDSGTTGSSYDTAIDIGDNDGGSSGAFAGDSALIGEGATAGSGDIAYTNGALDGGEDGSAAVAGNNNYASSTGSETGNYEGAFAGDGSNNTAIADTNYTTNFDGVDAGAGNGNFAYVDGPDNSTAVAGGTSPAFDGAPTTELGNNNIAIVSDAFAALTSTPDSAIAGSTDTTAGSSDLAEVLLTQGNAVADGGNLLYDIITLFGTIASP